MNFIQILGLTFMGFVVWGAGLIYFLEIADRFFHSLWFGCVAYMFMTGVAIWLIGTFV